MPDRESVEFRAFAGGPTRSAVFGATLREMRLGRSYGGLPLTGERETVGDGQHHGIDARVVRHLVVEGTDGDRVLVVGVGLHNPSVPEHVVDEDGAVVAHF